MTETRPVLGVGAIVVKDGALLMVRRAKDPGRGLWSLPGGRVERGEYLGEALRREVREETGVEITLEGLAGIFEVVGRDDHFVILDFSATAAAGEPAPGGDVDAARWVPLEEVTELDTTPRFVETLRGWGVL